MSNSYQRIPQSVDDASPPELAPPVIDPTDTSVLDSTDAADRSYRPLRESIRSEFNRPPPATWKRVLLVLAVLLMGYVAVKLGGIREKKPQVIYASRSVAFDPLSSLPTWSKPRFRAILLYAEQQVIVRHVLRVRPPTIAHALLRPRTVHVRESPG